MQLWYNNVPLHSLGTIEGGGQHWAPDPDATAPQRAKVTLKVRLHFIQISFGANRVQVDAARAALRVPRAILRWVNEATSAEYLNREVAIGAYDWPDDGKGNTRHQWIVLEFAWHEQDKTVPYLTATWRRSMSPPAVAPQLTLGNVSRFSEGYSAARYSPLRSARSGANGRVSLAGQFLADTTKPLADRAAAWSRSKSSG